ncbi:alpha/beta hydrolase [Phycicoccus sp. BSK3Z-2]|uniref:Alpha/beta hydrolase n=1 Tax=Phycicoccus avicenniae TaxID=2828860 RepID=A0A941D5G0_9MICO|nr:alpha/beta hydrolase [Phycicoccus avicenniae]MBR7742464.1 alpha/beta hydrolase [Phycicoccus avicenniae]
MTTFVTSSRGDRVALDDLGSGPAVVFVAGAGPSRADDEMTASTARLLADGGCRALVPDRLGRNESVAHGVLDLAREVAALRAVVDHVGEPVVLVGHSSGCSLALRAVADGVRAEGLVLWEAPLAGPAADTAAWAADVERHLDAGDLEAATEQYMRDMPPEWLDGMRSSPAWPRLAAATRTQRADAQALAWATAALEDRSLGSTVDLPVLTCFGSETFPEMPAAAARLAEVLPRATVAELPGAGHAWDPEAMAPVLARFLREVSVPGAQSD